MTDLKSLEKIIGTEDAAKVKITMDALATCRISKYDLTDTEKRHGFVLIITAKRQIVRAEMIFENCKWVPTGNVNILPF